jgi:hypothetical protein
MSLAVRREPHWLRLDEGAYLGFRRGPDTWNTRLRDGTGEQNYSALKVPAHVRDEFVEAKRLAAAWFGQMRGAALAKRGPVRNAVAYYLTRLVDRAGQRLPTSRGSGSASSFPKTTPWPTENSRAPSEKTSSNGGTDSFPAVSPRVSIDTPIRWRPRLNVALKGGHSGDARAWSLEALTNDASHDEATAVFLSPAQRKALLAKAAPAAADFFRGLTVL